MLTIIINYYRPQTKLRKGNVYRSMCQEFCPQGGSRHPRADTPLGRHPPPQADSYCSGMHSCYLPTGMHSCYLLLM